MKDFHYGTIHSKVEPFLFRYETEDFDLLNVKFYPNTDVLNIKNKVENIWQEFDPIHTVDATFYDNMIEEQYTDYSTLVKIVGVLAFLAITIAVLGLLGMVIFTTETRLKEISIRKVLGATENSLVYLLGKGFLLLLLISSVIAVPVTVIVFNKIILGDVAYHVTIGIIDTLTGPFLVILIGMLATGIITLFAARSNPATILRNE